MGKRRVAVVGFGAIGQYLVKALLTDAKTMEHLELGWVWNRTLTRITEEAAQLIGTPVPPECVCPELTGAFMQAHPVDLIVEVAHPGVYRTHGRLFLATADVFVGSPTALADQELFEELRGVAVAEQFPGDTHGLYVPSGALWGADDILKMGDRGSVTAATITMKKPHSSMKLEGALGEQLAAYAADNAATGECVLYDGPVGPLCPQAPNNVNTMACLAIASGLGFERTRGRLVASKALQAHVIEVTVTGKAIGDRTDPFTVSSTRYNPCDPNAVTASATYASFLASLTRAALCRGKGVHFC